MAQATVAFAAALTVATVVAATSSAVPGLPNGCIFNVTTGVLESCAGFKGTRLSLEHVDVAAVRVDAFTGLRQVEVLLLNSSQSKLLELPPGVLAPLTSLSVLAVRGGSEDVVLPISSELFGVGRGGTQLRWLELRGFIGVIDGSLHGLAGTPLEVLSLSGAHLPNVPAALFHGLGNLTTLDLSRKYVCRFAFHHAHAVKLTK